MKRKSSEREGLRLWAEFSECEKYRYTLGRQWGTGDLLNWVMLNPSTADERDNDPTIERCERRAKMWGYGGLIVTNLFALRATKPEDMKAHGEPIGIDNDEAIASTASQCQIVICAWGNDGSHLGRSREVLAKLRETHKPKLRYLKLSGKGEPYHPLYVPYAVGPQAWVEAREMAEAPEPSLRTRQVALWQVKPMSRERG